MISHPQHHHRRHFSVEFEYVETHKQSYDSEMNLIVVDEEAVKQSLKTITKHIVSVDLGTENLLVPEAMHRTNRLILWVSQGNDGSLMKAIRTMQKYQASFNLFFAVTNGSGYYTYPSNGDLSGGEWVPPVVNELYCFSKCQLEALQHSLFSYEEENRNDPSRPSMKLLQVQFADMIFDSKPLGTQ